MQDALDHLFLGHPLSEAQSQAAFGSVMDGAATPEQIASLLTLLAKHAPTADEIVGAVRAMRARMVRVQVPAGKMAVDIVGTGGDHAGTFNVSSAASFVAAAAGASSGMVIAKHGNRSVTSTTGSSQVLEALGVTLTGVPAQLTRCLEEAGIAFLFAPNHHPAMKHAAPVRAALGFRTLFNVLGPLTNPTGAKRQVVGVFDRALMPVMAQALVRLESEKAWVVHGELHAGQGLDELSPTGASSALKVAGGKIEEEAFAPQALGLSGGDPVHLAAADPLASAKMIRNIFAGEKGLPRDAVVLNAAAALVVGEVATDLRQGLEMACAAIDSGRAAQVLAKLVEVSRVS